MTDKLREAFDAALKLTPEFAPEFAQHRAWAEQFAWLLVRDTVAALAAVPEPLMLDALLSWRRAAEIIDPEERFDAMEAAQAARDAAIDRAREAQELANRKVKKTR